MIKNIYVFDMGKVITKPSKLDKVYSAGEMKCSYLDFKTNFYHSKESDEVYKGLITDDEFFEFIRKTCGSTKTVDELKKLYNLSKGGIYPDTIKLIQELKDSGNSVHLLSNLKQIDYDYLSSHMDLTLFDRLFLSFKLGMSKPHEDIYKYVIESLGTPDFYFFDDSLENITAAKKLGIHAHQTTGEDIVKCLRRIRRM